MECSTIIFIGYKPNHHAKCSIDANNGEPYRTPPHFSCSSTRAESVLGGYRKMLSQSEKYGTCRAYTININLSYGSSSGSHRRSKKKNRNDEFDTSTTGGDQLEPAGRALVFFSSSSSVSSDEEWILSSIRKQDSRVEND